MKLVILLAGVLSFSFASVTDLPPGKYYLFCIANTREAGVVWNLPIDTAITSTVILDNKNAAFAY